MSKYNSKKTVVDGQVFDSRKEAKRYQELALLENVGAIKNLSRQVKFVLIPSQRDENGKLIERECSYKADLMYYDEAGETIVEDVKGYRTKEYIIKRKLMLYQYGIRIREV